MSSNSAASTPGGATTAPAVPSIRVEASENGKGDTEMADANDDVEEYDFANESDSEEEDEGRDTDYYKNPGGVITIGDSDDDKPPENNWQHDHRPWLDAAFTDESRRNWEIMYTRLANFAMHGDWQKTEDYQHYKDREMARYLKDYPPGKWVLPLAEAEAAVNNLEERKRWRKLGIRIFGAQAQPHVGNFPPFQRTGGPPLGQPMGPPMGPPMYPQNYMQQPQYPGHPQMYAPGPTYGQPPGYGPQAVPAQSNFQMRPNPQMQMQAPLQQQYMPQNMNYPPSGMPQQGYHPQGVNGNRPRSAGDRVGNGRMLQPPMLEPTPSRVRIPPYDTRNRPIDPRDAGRNKGKRPAAQPDVYPWNRKLDFTAERSRAKWEMKEYDAVVMDGMEGVRQRNRMRIESTKKSSKQLQDTAGAMPYHNRGSSAASSPDAEGSTPNARKSGPKTGKSVHFGESRPSPRYDCYEFVTDRDRQRAAGLLRMPFTQSTPTPEDVFDAYDRKQFALDATRDLMICWNPHKIGSEQLEKGAFRVKDHLVTEEQLEQTPILTRRAADCLIDFCPDLLWREILLRIVSESGYINKEIRDRVSWNGNLVDNSTFTKRIGSALGMKQQQSNTRQPKRPRLEGYASDQASQKVKGYAEGEDEYYNNNTMDHEDYMAYFGKNTSHRNKLDLGKDRQRAGEKRKNPPSDEPVEEEEEEDDGEIEEEPINRRQRHQQPVGLSQMSDADIEAARARARMNRGTMRPGVDSTPASVLAKLAELREQNGEGDSDDEAPFPPRRANADRGHMITNADGVDVSVYSVEGVRLAVAAEAAKVKAAKASKEKASDAMDGVEENGDGGEAGDEEELEIGGDDAVSEQSDTMLDEIED